MNYQELSSKMRVKPSFASAEEVIKKDYPLKLPNRTSLHIWNSPEISAFRGFQEDLNASEKAKETHTRETLEIRQAARESSTHTPDMDLVHGMMTHQRQQADMLDQHARNLQALHNRSVEGLRLEQRAELERLAAAQSIAANRSRIAEEALQGVRDTMLEHRNFIGQLASQQGVQSPVIPETALTTIHNHHYDTNLHSNVMNVMNSHASQFGQFMHQQNINAEQMQRVLYEHMARQQQPVIHIIRPPDEQPMQIEAFTGGGPPPPPPSGSKVKAGAKGKKDKDKPRPINITYGTGPPPPAPPPAAAMLAPDPIAVPTIPSAVPYYDIGTPRPRQPRGRSRQPRASPYTGDRMNAPIPPAAIAAVAAPAAPPPPAPPAAPAAPAAPATASSSMVPWSGGVKNPPPMPPPMPTPKGRAKATAKATAKDTAKARSKTRSVSVASAAETVYYPEEAQPIQPAPKGRSKTRSLSLPSSVDTVFYPDATIQPAPKARGRPRKAPLVTLPTDEAASLHENASKMKALNARVLANAAKFSRPRGKSVPAKKEKPEPIPDEAPTTKKLRVRTVSLGPSGDEALKRGRGRPKGSLGKAKLVGAA